jgi:hypothetical protein
MEQVNNAALETLPAATVTEQSTIRPFIEANTIASTLEDIQDNHIIPVYVKDNERLIAQSEFIDMTYELAKEIYASDVILSPSIRLSHPIKAECHQHEIRLLVSCMTMRKRSTMKGWPLLLRYPLSDLKLTATFSV